MTASNKKRIAAIEARLAELEEIIECAEDGLSSELEEACNEQNNLFFELESLEKQNET